jgi:hypothetical protein
MARRRTKKRSSGRRRRVSGGVKNARIETALGVILGAAGGMLLNSELAKATKPIDPKIIALGELVLGFLAPSFIKGNIVQGIGFGLIAAGGSSALKEFDIISGLPLISGYQRMNVINGVPEVVQQYMPKKSNGRPASTSETLAGMGMFDGRN